MDWFTVATCQVKEAGSELVMKGMQNVSSSIITIDIDEECLLQLSVYPSMEKLNAQPSTGNASLRGTVTT